MSAPGIPQSVYVQSANREILISWDMSPGADSYEIQRSVDNVTYSLIATISGSPLATSYLDTAVVTGTQYFYKLRALTGVDASSYTIPQSEVPVPTGEMSLGQIRLKAMQSADRVNSNFVTVPEWNSFINIAMFELYDLLVTEYEDYFIQPVPAQFTVNGNDFIYPLPDGLLTFQNGLNNSQADFVAPPFYKLMGVDLALNNATNAYVTINKFNFINRNRFVYPNTASTIYGVFNLQYRVMGTNIEFIPTPTSGQKVRLWYIPRLRELLRDTDITTAGVSGWIRYVIVRAAKYALDKEESDSSKQTEEIMFLKDRIEAAASNRDAGQPDTISDTRSGNGWGNNGSGGFNGGTAGF